MKHPYTSGLEYGWGDDALNVEGHHLLSKLSKIFHLSPKQREEIESEFTEALPAISQGVGAGKTALKAYVTDLENWVPSQANKCAQYLGRLALDVGMTKNGWKNVYSWMNSIGLGTGFAMGAWMEGDEPKEVEIPAFFDDIVSILGI